MPCRGLLVHLLIRSIKPIAQTQALQANCIDQLTRRPSVRRKIVRKLPLSSRISTGRDSKPSYVHDEIVRCPRVAQMAEQWSDMSHHLCSLCPRCLHGRCIIRAWHVPRIRRPLLGQYDSDGAISEDNHANYLIWTQTFLHGSLNPERFTMS